MFFQFTKFAKKKKVHFSNPQNAFGRSFEPFYLRVIL